MAVTGLLQTFDLRPYTRTRVTASGELIGLQLMLVSDNSLFLAVILQV
jgi:hypothetical protein